MGIFPESFRNDAFILIVDDNPEIRNVLTQMLRSLGFSNTYQESDGLRAYERIKSKEHPYELVFSDWKMSGLTGLGLLVRIRKDIHLKTISFIMITGSNEEHNVKFAVNAGVDAYLLKPFTTEDIKNKMHIAFQKAAKR